MEQRQFGAAGPEVSVIGQGTWNLESGDRARAVAALRKGLDLGMTHIDTAEYYGAAENVVGEAIAGRRREVFLVSKVMPSNASRRGTIEACEKTLAKVNSDYLDCYLLHWRGRYPLEETFSAFEQLQQAGKIRSWGVSNFDVPDLEDAVKAGGAAMACNQVLYHLQERAIEHAVLPWCEQHGVAVVAYSPFGSGNFPGIRVSGRKVLDEIAEARGLTARQVALAFLVRREPVLTIPKASSPEHAAENAAAGKLRLSDAEIERLDQAFPRGPKPRSLPMI
ncbi:MAG: aldo/keto reductase [Bryobacterales bacterium]|nr:aldo/keto reductase [Bryobacterales bacterium]